MQSSFYIRVLIFYTLQIDQVNQQISFKFKGIVLRTINGSYSFVWKLKVFDIDIISYRLSCIRHASNIKGEFAYRFGLKVFNGTNLCIRKQIIKKKTNIKLPHLAVFNYMQQTENNSIWQYYWIVWGPLTPKPILFSCRIYETNTGMILQILPLSSIALFVDLPETVRF